MISAIHWLTSIKNVENYNIILTRGVQCQRHQEDTGGFAENFSKVRVDFSNSGGIKWPPEAKYPPFPVFTHIKFSLNCFKFILNPVIMVKLPKMANKMANFPGKMEMEMEMEMEKSRGS